MNRQIWEMYKSSDRGREMINLFSFYADTDIEVFENKLENILNRFSEESNIETSFSWIYLISDNITLNKSSIQENENVKDFFVRLY